MDVVGRIDTPAWKHVRAPEKSDTVAALYQKSLERVIAPEKDDG